MQCTVKLGQSKGEPSDFIEGDIVWKGFPMSKISGSFMSHIEFDDKRYWDIRENFPITFIEVNKHTPSSSIVREDRILLDKDKVENAQTAKEAIENLQRKDRKLREKYHGKQH